MWFKKKNSSFKEVYFQGNMEIVLGSKSREVVQHHQIPYHVYTSVSSSLKMSISTLGLQWALNLTGKASDMISLSIIMLSSHTSPVWESNIEAILKYTEQH